MLLEKIEKLCSEKGITLNRVEVLCGFSHGSIRKWKDHPPSVYRVKSVCDVLGIKLDDLFEE